MEVTDIETGDLTSRWDFLSKLEINCDHVWDIACDWAMTSDKDTGPSMLDENNVSLRMDLHSSLRAKFACK
jgi:hypothetical protein